MLISFLNSSQTSGVQNHFDRCGSADMPGHGLANQLAFHLTDRSSIWWSSKASMRCPVSHLRLKLQQFDSVHMFCNWATKSWICKNELVIRANCSKKSKSKYSTPARINCNWWRTRPFDAKMLGSHSSQRIDLRHAPSHFNAKFLSTPKWVALLAIFILWGEQMKGGCLTFEPPSIKPQIKEPFWKANRRAHESEGNGSFDSQLLRPPEESPHRFSTLD